MDESTLTLEDLGAAGAPSINRRLAAGVSPDDILASYRLESQPLVARYLVSLGYDPADPSTLPLLSEDEQEGGTAPLSRWRDRPFPEGKPPDARTSIAVTLTRRNFPWLDHIGPATWADAGAIIKALRAAGFAVRKVVP